MPNARSRKPRSAEAALDALALGDEFPPKRVKLFAAGMNRTTKGEFLFDDEAARSVMAAFGEHGVDLAMDFDHASLAPPDGRKRDVPGYFRPEVEDGALYAVPQWTAVGLAAIKPGEGGTLPEYRYVSPTFIFDPDTRRVLRLGPLALTPYPATHNARPMVLDASDDPPSPATMDAAAQCAQPAQETPTMTATSAVLVALGAQDEAAGLAALTALNTNLSTARAELSALVTAAGAKTHAEALGAIEGWKRDAASLAALTARVQAEEAARAKAARDAALDACVTEGKLTPAERASADAPGSWLAALATAEAVESYRAARSPVVALAATEPKPQGATARDVSDDDVRFVKQFVPNATTDAVAAAIR